MRTALSIKAISLFVLSACSAPAWAEYKMLIHNVALEMSDGFVTTYQLPQPSGWYISADEEGRLLSATWGYTTSFPGHPAAGIASVSIKNSQGKVVFDIDQRGLLGEVNEFGSNRGLVGMIVFADTTDHAPPAQHNRVRPVAISPATFAAGGQIIISFAGKVPEETHQFVLGTSLLTDNTNLPPGPVSSNSLGGISFDESNPKGGGQAKITIDFTLIEE